MIDKDGLVDVHPITSVINNRRAYFIFTLPTFF